MPSSRRFARCWRFFASRTPLMRPTFPADGVETGRGLVRVGHLGPRLPPVGRRTGNGAKKPPAGTSVRDSAPSGHALGVTKLRRFPWRPVVLSALLGVALGISVANGRTDDAVIIAVMLVLG